MVNGLKSTHGGVFRVKQGKKVRVRNQIDRIELENQIEYFLVTLRRLITETRKGKVIVNRLTMV